VVTTVKRNTLLAEIQAFKKRLGCEVGKPFQSLS